MPLTERPAPRRPPVRITAEHPKPIENRIGPRTVRDVVREVRVRLRGPLPAGSHYPSLHNTWQGLADPLRFLLGHYERFGPVFTIRSLHEPVVWAIGPEANHQILVSEFDAFSWRRGRYRDLAPLLGDGMLNIDGAYHREMRKLLLPAFHREQVEASTAVMLDEALRSADELKPGRIDLYAWVRDVALRIALRGLLGMEVGTERTHEMAKAFSRALDVYGLPLPVQFLRGPGTPDAHAQTGRKALDRLIRDEVAERRRSGDHGAGVLGMLLDATDGDGDPLPVTAIRDQALTLLFAGHDTTTATLTFLFYELGRSLDAREAVEDELDRVLDGRLPTSGDLNGQALPILERTLSETLRRYPAAWIGPRRTVRDVTLAGVHVPAGIAVHYSSWATHHLPEFWPDPLAFQPDRFRPDAVAARPKGAYIPFGGGSRMCLGKRFGEYELRALAAVLLSRFRFSPDPGDTLRITTTPTLGPAGGLRFDVQRRTCPRPPRERRSLG